MRLQNLAVAPDSADHVSHYVVLEIPQSYPVKLPSVAPAGFVSATILAYDMLTRLSKVDCAASS